MKLDHKQFQALSQCEAHAMAKEVKTEIDRAFIEGGKQGFSNGIMQAHEEINKRLKDMGLDIDFTYKII
jgi:hypothetical protein